MRRRLLSLCLLSALVASGCDDDSSLSTTSITTTEVAVSPSAFVDGAVRCSPNAGALQSYVVTLLAFDDATDPTPLQVSSSLAVPCSLEVGFREVVIAGKRYGAQIDGYDVPANDLTPQFGPSSGSREMLSLSTGQVVSPRWTSRCGTSASDAVEATLQARVMLSKCESLLDASSSDTAIEIDPAQVLGDDGCALSSSVSLTSVEGQLADQPDLACDAAVVKLNGVQPGLHTMYATLTDARQTLFGMRCTAWARPSLTVPLQCDPPTPHGAIVIHHPGSGSEGCPSDHRYTVLDGSNVLASSQPCDSPVLLDQLEPRAYELTLQVRGPDGSPHGASSMCSALVQPGLTSDAACTP